MSVPIGRIKAIRYEPIIAPEKFSVVDISNPELFNSEKLPINNGLYDAAMGSIDYDYRCKTCSKMLLDCPGHFGSISLAYPVIAPSWYHMVRQWLKAICLSCGASMINLEKLADVPRINRLARAASKSVGNSSAGAEGRTQNVKLCPSCGKPHPKIKDEKNNRQNIVAIFYEGQRQNILPLPVHIIDQIFNIISDDIVAFLAPNSSHHPRNYIWHRLLIAPVSVRPDTALIRDTADSNMNPELTSWYMMLIKKNNSLLRNGTMLTAFLSVNYDNYVGNPQIITEYDVVRKDAMLFNMLVFGCILGWSASSKTNALRIEIGSSGNKFSIRSQLPNKHGIIRRDMMGVRTDGFRDTIYGDSLARIDTLTLPAYLAQNVQKYEVIQKYNEEFIRTLLRNGKNVYPGVKEIIKKNGHHHNKFDNITLEYGDAVMRDLVDGDMVYFNRQPSLTDTSLTSYKVKINRNEENHAIGFNPVGTTLFNADFDGDAMQGGCVVTAPARAEIKYLLSVIQRFTSSQYSTPVYGFIQDAIVGIFYLTRSRTRLHKSIAMQLFSTSDAFPDMSADKVYTGRELISIILPPGLNYKGTPSCASERNKALYPFQADEVKVVIEGGVMKSGILDMSAVKAGVSNSLFQVVNREFGAEYAIKFMFQLQQVAGLYCDMYGLTLGPSDYHISELSRELINRKTKAYLDKVAEINKKLIEGKITAPFNTTVEEKYESMIIKTLSFDYYNEILSGINPESNMLNMVLPGARGKANNIGYMVAPRLQILIFGRRPERQYTYRRSLPYTPRYSLDPTDNGLVLGSLFGGISLKEYIFNTFEDRNSLIIKALSTAETGMHTRLLIKNLESLIVNFWRLVVKDKNIVQYVYGLNNYNSSSVEYVSLEHVEMNDADFDAKFKPKTDAHAEFHHEYSRIKNDRATYRAYWIGQEGLSIAPVFGKKIQVPMPIDHLSYKFRRHDGRSCGQEELIKMVKYINWWCEEHLPYVFFNAQYERANGFVPDFLRYAIQTTAMHVREFLHSSRIKDQLNYDYLKNILDIYYVLVKSALVSPGTAIGVLAAQCDGETSTQTNLDATHGASSQGSTKAGMDRVREVLNVSDVKKTRNSAMTLEFSPDVKDTELALSFIEEAKLRIFTTRRQIFYENYHQPVHPNYKSEIDAWMKIWDKVNHNINPPPSSLSRFCFRFEIFKELLIVKHSNIGELAASISRAFPTIYCTFTTENVPTPTMRVYTTENIKSLDAAIKFMNQLLNHNIRGITNVISAYLDDRPNRKIEEDGSLTMKREPVITTYGTNLSEVAKIKAININRMQSDSPPEMARIFGIEAARQKLANELTLLVSTNMNVAHTVIIADEMCMTGQLTKIARKGIDVREPNNTLLRMSNQSAYQVLRDAAHRCNKNNIYGISAPLFLGQIPQIGTNYSEIVIRNDVAATDIKPVEEEINIDDALANF